MNKVSKYEVVDYDRMFVYIWSEDEHECKFGQRYVNKGENPYDECLKRIRESMGVRKDKFDNNEIVINGIFDITEYCKKVNMFYKKSKVDDHIRKEIGFIKQSEVHSLSADIFISYLISFLSKSETTFRPTYKPRFYQDYINLLFIDKLSKSQNDKIDFVLELAPRFGKTIWTIDVINTLFNDFGYKICFLPAYVLTANSSFKKEFYNFNGYSDNMVFVSYNDDKIIDIVKENYGKKMIIVETSLHMNEFENKLSFVNEIPTHEKVCVMDESDFGVHTNNCQDIIRFINGKLNVYMSGTGIEKVMNPLENLDDNIIRWSYTDMLLVKKGEHPLQKYLVD